MQMFCGGLCGVFVFGVFGVFGVGESDGEEKRRVRADGDDDTQVLYLQKDAHQVGRRDRLSAN
jgi:hypothetical protein